jgi:hypothetical protein
MFVEMTNPLEVPLGRRLPQRHRYGRGAQDDRDNDEIFFIMARSPNVARSTASVCLPAAPETCASRVMAREACCPFVEVEDLLGAERHNFAGVPLI